MNIRVKNFLIKYKSLLALIVLCLVISIIQPRFLTISNISTVLTQVSMNAIIAIGMTFVILTGGIDLSVGSIIAITGAVAASILTAGGSVFTAIIAAVAIGGAIGYLNGFFVARARIQAFIVTLATMTIFRGVTYVYTGGNPISGLGQAFNVIGNKKVLGLPVPVLIMTVVFVIGAYVLTQTRFGRYVYAIGGNEDSSRLSGINTKNIKNLVYMISGIAASIAGIIVTSRIGSASPNAGSSYELDAIAAVVLGGTSLSGGEGRIFGTIIGALIIGVLNNSLNLLNVSTFYQSIVKGAVILLAVLIDKRNKS